MKIVTEDDEYYETMIRAEKRVDPKEEIAELKKRSVAIYDTIHTARRLLVDRHLYESRVLDEVCKLLIDLNENPEVAGYGKQLADNIISDVVNKVVPTEGPNQTQLPDWEQRQSQERPVRPRPILGNRTADYNPAARAARIEENRLNSRTSGSMFGMGLPVNNPYHQNPVMNHIENRLTPARREVFLHQQRDLVRMISNGSVNFSSLTNNDTWTDQERQWILAAAFPNGTAPNQLSGSPLNDAAREMNASAAREMNARREATCQFGGVGCEHEATVMNEHGTPMCDPCSERDFQARGNDFNYEMLPFTPSPHPTR